MPKTSPLCAVSLCILQDNIKAGLLTYTIRKSYLRALSPPSRFPNDRLSPMDIKLWYIQRLVPSGAFTRFPFHRPCPSGTAGTLYEYSVYNSITDFCVFCNKQNKQKRNCIRVLNQIEFLFSRTKFLFNNQFKPSL